MKSSHNPRLRTLTWGALPLVVLTAAATLDHIPGTNISLTVPYAAEGPGPTVDTLGMADGVEVVEISAQDEAGITIDDPAGQLNMTTVAVRTNMTLVQALGRWIGSGDTLVPIEAIFPKGHSEEEVQEANQIAFSQSESAATLVAMDYLQLPVHVEVAGVAEDSAAAGTLEQDDILLALDGKKITQPQQAQEVIQAKKPGDKLQVTVERAGKELHKTVTLKEHPETKGQALLGILMITVPDNGLEVNYNLEDIGGPSAGMMFTLAVIDKLSPGDLTGGHFVAGTGTIEPDGTVGAIGGIVHKVRAAKDAGAELFLAPADNCAEAVSRSTGDMVVARVEDIEDATQALEDFAAGRPVVACED
ncbi:signal protein PDZ [Corynebacterium phocae]|uniref:endopeptidase La n=1 Tax=Corynebacterium phocae TaxID=161895 RepID=A0A1L7D4J5_9CORY|nr:PDZ domain-containing protein [Corynebacterium phocae]APT93064.1 signal protein PDZ [Corynebacterium phocae]